MLGDEVFDNVLFASGAARSKKRPVLVEIDTENSPTRKRIHPIEGGLIVLLGFLGDSIDFFKRRNSSEHL